jgi:serine protease Do
MKFLTLLLVSFSLFSAPQDPASAVVFIATEYNSFDEAYPDPWFFQRPLRSFYETFWPNCYFHGSGFIIDPSGYIVTNEHVAEKTTSFLVVLQSGNERIRSATLVGKDFRSDIAVLKIDNPDNESFPVLKFGDARAVQVGDTVYAYGTPISPYVESTVTAGIISGKNRNSSHSALIEGFIQTDASINAGNSGGPLLNEQGEVIGVNSWGYSHCSGYEGVSFALPSHLTEKVAKQLIRSGKVTQGYLGAKVNLSKIYAFNVYRFDPQTPAKLIHIKKNSPAEQAGLRVGDIVLKINGEPISSPFEFRNEILCYPERARLQFTIERNHKKMVLLVTLGKDELAT